MRGGARESHRHAGNVLWLVRIPLLALALPLGCASMQYDGPAYHRLAEEWGRDVSLVWDQCEAQAAAAFALSGGTGPSEISAGPFGDARTVEKLGHLHLRQSELCYEVFEDEIPLTEAQVEELVGYWRRLWAAGREKVPE